MPDESTPADPGEDAVWAGWITSRGSLAFILLVAFGLRVHDLDRYSLWHDEVVTMRLARTAGPPELFRLLDQIDGTRAPLHPLALQGWLRAFGASELAGRSLSLVCGLGTVIAVYALGRALAGTPVVGRWAAWLAAVSPPLVYYSQEARMYAWLVLLTCLSWLVFAGFRRKARPGSMVLYGLLLAAMVYSHPLGLFMVAAHGLAYLLVRRSLTPGFLPWLAIQLVVLLAIAPWIPRYLDHGTDYPLPRYSLRFLLAAPIEYIGGNSLVLLACILIIAWGLLGREEGRGSFRLICPAENAVLLTWAIVPPLLMFLYSQVGRPIFGPPRYHLFSAPAYLILLAQGLCRFPLTVRLPLVAGALYLSLSLLSANVYSQAVKADWRELAHRLEREASTTAPEETLLVVHPSDLRFPRDQIHAAHYYLSPRYRLMEAADPAAQVGGGSGVETLDVFCLTAEQVRRGVRDLNETDLPDTLWRKSDRAWKPGESDPYGLIVRRRR